MTGNFYASYGGSNGGGGGGGSTTLEIEYRTITVGEAGTKSLVLAVAPLTPTEVIFQVASAPTQVCGADFTVAGSTLSWSGLGLDGILTSGDLVLIEYAT